MRWLYIFRKTLKNVAFTGSYLDLIDVPPSPASAPIITASDGLEAVPVVDGLDIQMIDVGTAGTYGIVTTNVKGQVTAGKRQMIFSGVTNASGVYSANFGVTFAAAPNVQAQIVGGTSNQVVTITVTATGFSATLVQRNAVTLLGLEVLLAGTTPVNGGRIDVLITEK